MSDKPQFERVNDYEFKEKETVYVIDKNDYDIWEAKIMKIEGQKFSVHYPDYTSDDEDITDVNRILVSTKINKRIYNIQESKRAEVLPPLSSGSEPFSDNDGNDDDEVDFKPAFPLSKEKPKKKKSKSKKEKETKISKKRPEGVRSNPPRGSSKN